MATRPIRDSRSVVLDGSGQGIVTFGPTRGNTTWDVERMSVKVSSNADEPQANVYRGTINPGSLISGTYSGANDTDSQVNDGPLFNGEYYTCQWTGGDPGAVATITFYAVETTQE